MSDESVSRNYAETLLALAQKANAVDEWSGLINAVAGASSRTSRCAASSRRRR